MSLASETNTPTTESATSTPRQAARRREPLFDPPTILPRIAELVRTLAAMTSEVCNCSDQGTPVEEFLPGVDPNELMDCLMLAQTALARCLLPADDIEREGRLALARLKGDDTTRGLYRAVMTMAATMASYPGDPLWPGTLLPAAAIRPPEPSIIEARAVTRAMRLAQQRREPAYDAWSTSSTAEDAEDEEHDNGAERVSAAEGLS